MKKKLVSGLCAIACMASVFSPAGEFAMAKTIQDSASVKTATSAKGTINVPNQKTNVQVTPSTMMGTLVQGTTEADSYNLVVEKSALNVQLTTNGNVAGATKMTLKTAAGVEVGSVTQHGNGSSLLSSVPVEQGNYILEVSPASGAAVQTQYQIATSSISAATEDALELYGDTSLAYAGAGEVQYREVEVETAGILAISSVQFATSDLGNYYANSGQVNFQKQKIALCDEYMEELVPMAEGEYSTYTKTYGVKKGVYYIKIEGNANYYTMASTFTGGSLATNKKANAKKITKKFKDYAMLAEVGNKKATQWYKFTFNTATKKKVILKFLGEGALDVKIYRETQEVYSREQFPANKKLSVFMKSTVKGNQIPWQKGTYYVKVTRNADYDYTNGLISVRLK